ncbi:xaa-Pro aminopeptidase [Cladophialophora psammophila CBS 110553]|uniref:Probable Xaa-Pro aminopeptidase P n=1 Tax=Cladophialophora psammophila CBS 110553 TaxID=1182543 RepID=W9XDZ5_9EURO|nr:xaa-Pro aminopeptidase [Cladophialophora psammophila CBS 110553]EXJ75555.1 xaa-Pro aminopeptidase [Cladophialophora psammophila CBS 110553]
MEKVDTTKRLSQLRDRMREHKLDVYIVPSEDSHQSEYIAPCDARRAYISGFTGSAGTAVITLEKAALSTDGRYFNQASKQLDENWLLLKQGMEDVPTWQEWTTEQAEGGKTVGVDPTVITASDARKLSETLKKKSHATLVGVSENLVDNIWNDRPPRPAERVIVLSEKYAGKPYQQKLDDLRKELKKKKAVGMVVSMLDEVAWLFNLRGSDIPYNPVFFSYAAVTPNSATLYIDSAKIGSEVREHLEGAVEIKSYDDLFSDLTSIAETAAIEFQTNGVTKSHPNRLLLSNKSSWALYLGLGGEDKVEESRSPIADAKAIKNPTELEGMRQCHIRDGAALSEYFAWLEGELHNGSWVDEVQAADKLEAIRSKGEHFVGLSFDTISATGPNAAVIHYSPERGNCSTIDVRAVYLCDSGAQYLDGTTDTTRTLHFGTPSDMEIKAYTLVLKGVIALDRAVFPKGTTGFAIDAFARQHLWREGLDYRHGTGHGVGSYLNVHEGPIGIGTRAAYSEVSLSIGNVISDEPGYYEDGNFGIRIENMIMACEAKTNHKFGDKPWIGFEHVTMVPMCRKLIDPSLLDPEERAWLNAYHEEVWEKTSGFFDKDERTTKWLRRETAPI